MFIHIPRLRRFIKKNHIKTLTVDVFDTVLMRKIYPEERQFYKHAQAVSEFLEPKINQKLNPFYLVSLRKFCRHVNDDVKQDKKKDRESHIEKIFSLMLQLIFEQHEVALGKAEKEEMIKKMVQEELELEKKWLTPNHALIKFLRAAKDQGLKIYFLSDIYLDSQHIHELFTHFQINDLFEGGVSSANLDYCKGTGKLFKKIKKENLIPGLNFTTNLHIGDNPISDVLSPRRSGSHAWHWWTFHHRMTRRIKTFFGIFSHHLNRRKYEWTQYRSLEKQSQEKQAGLSSYQKELHQTGSLLAPALIHYFTYLHLYASADKLPLYFLSSEGKTFQHYFKKLGFNEPTHILHSYNRINTLRTFAYLSLTKPLIQYSQAIVHLFFHGEGKRTLSDLLKSMGIKQQQLGLSDLALHHMPAEKFVNKLIKTLRKTNHPELRETYQKLIHELSSSRLLNHKKILLGDVGWNGTIQILLEQVLQLLNKNTKTMGVYLGSTGFNIFGLENRKNIKGIIYPHLYHKNFQKMLVEEIWEYVLTAKKPRDEKLQWIQKGIEDTLEIYKNSLQVTSTDLFRITKNELEQLLYHPTRQQVLLLGSIEHDAGFGVDKSRPLVELTHHPLKLYWLMAFRPEEFKQLYLRQYWERGFLRWYKLQLIQPIINVLRWIKRKNEQILG